MQAVVPWPGTDKFVTAIRVQDGDLVYISVQDTSSGTTPMDSFNCSACSLFKLWPVLPNERLLFTYASSGEGVVVNYIQLSFATVAVIPIGTIPSETLQSVVVFDGDSYIVQLSNRFAIVRLTEVPSMDIVPNEPTMRTYVKESVSTMRLPGGGHKIAVTLQDRYKLDAPSRAVLLDVQLCRDDSQCPPGLSCNGSICNVVAPPSAAPAAPNGAAPSSCPLPAPFDATCINGIYVVSNSTSSGSSVVIVAPVFINGSLTLTNASAITIQNNASITVSGCLTVGGDLILKLPFESGQASGNITVIEFGGGYCSGSPGTFKSATVVAEGAPACTKVKNTVGYGERSISVLYQYDISGCAPNDASVAALSVGAIVGIAVGGAAFVAIVLATVFYVRFRQKVMPFDARRKASAANDHELE
jgi:hypothetical protein